MERQQKEKLVDDLSKRFVEAKAVYLTHFTGLTVESITELRNEVRKAGGQYQVIKNTLASFSTKGTQYEVLTKDLTGPVGWAMTVDDPVVLAKTLRDFRKKNEKFNYWKGILEGNEIDGKAIESIADMPPKEVLLAQLLGVIQGPARNLASVIQAVPRQLVNIMEAIRKKKEEETNNG